MALSNKLVKWLAPLAGAGIWTGLAGFYATWVERGWLQTTYHRVKLEGLPQEWQGFRVAFLSDFHIEPDTFHTKATEDAVAQVIAERPDLVALGGDYADTGKWNPNLVRILSPLAEANLRIVGVVGNHDYRGGMRGRYGIEQGLQALGVSVLIDDACPITHNGVTQWVAGIDDISKGIGDYGRAVARIPEGQRPFLLLTHNPLFMKNEAPPNCCGFALAGHIHGGQINPAPPPFSERLNWVKWGPNDMRSPYTQGWYEVSGNKFYVGRGLGVTKLPVRFGSRPELAFFELE